MAKSIPTTGTPAAPAHPVYVSFTSEISNKTVEGLLATIGNLIAQGKKDIHLLISTPGGQVNVGISAFNTLMGLPINLTTHNVGNVDSIGNVIFLAGTTRYACSNSRFMFHGVGHQVSGNVKFEEKNIREMLDSILADQKLIASIVAGRSNIDAKEIESLFAKAAFIEASEAGGKGLIHDIREVNVPDGAEFLQLIFQR